MKTMATREQITAAMKKIGSSLDYLRSVRHVGKCWRMDWETPGVDDGDRQAALMLRAAFSEALAELRFEDMLRNERIALRRAARKDGQRVIKLLQWNDATDPRIFKYAKRAASNAFAAHPELRAS
jgi:hypothetical protein